jgi:hypothetical protein
MLKENPYGEKTAKEIFKVSKKLCFVETRGLRKIFVIPSNLIIKKQQIIVHPKIDILLYIII